MKDEQLKQALCDKESAENDLKELRLSLDDASRTVKYTLQEQLKQALRDKETAEKDLKELRLSLDDASESISQEWEEEKTQVMVQIRGYKRENDAIKSALAQEKEKVAKLEQQLAKMTGLGEEINKLTAERDTLDLKVHVHVLHN